MPCEFIPELQCYFKQIFVLYKTVIIMKSVLWQFQSGKFYIDWFLYFMHIVMETCWFVEEPLAQEYGTCV